MQQHKREEMQTKGFTLIELLVTMAIVGILAAIAYPQYRNSVRRSDRADAKVALQSATQAMERCYAEHRNYTDSSCLFSVPNAGTISSPSGYYEVSAPTVTTTSYAITATPVAGGPQSSDTDCTSFTLTSTGAQTATGQNTDECW